MRGPAIFAVALLLLFRGILLSNETHPLAGTSGAQFLRIGVGARPLGMAESFASVGGDIYSLYWNPAGLADLRTPQFALTYHRWIVDTHGAYIAYAHPWEGVGTLAAGYALFHAGEMERTGINSAGEPVRTGERFVAYDMALRVAWGRSVSETLALGVVIVPIYRAIDRARAFGVAFDGGAQYRPPVENLVLGVSAKNFGPGGMRFEVAEDPFPGVVMLGASYKPFGENSTISTDVHIPTDDFVTQHLGAELCLGDSIAFRGGYRANLGRMMAQRSWSRAGNVLGGWTGLHLGMGVRWEKFALDYAFVPYGELDEVGTHRATFVWTF
ncbi:MAG: PorV/PorQ family protein [bacterium]